MKSTTLYALITFLFSLNIFQVINSYSYKNIIKEKEKLLIRLNENHEEQLNRFTQKDSLQFLSENKFVNGNIGLIDMENNPILLSEIFDTNLKVVFRYSELNCSACYEKNILDFKYFIKLFGKDNVILLADYKNLRDLYNFLRINELDCKVFNLHGNKLNLAIENGNFPYFLLLDNELKANCVFGISTSNPRLTYKYLLHIKKACF